MTLDLDPIRRAVAAELESRAISTWSFIEDILAGRRDDGPFMVGAIAWAKRAQQVMVDAAQ